MEIIKDAVITEDKKIKCAICGKTNGMVTGHETIVNFRIRCRGSRRGHEHFILLNIEPEENR